MKELQEVIIKNLIEDSEAVVITEKNEEKSTTYEVKVSEKDMGKVIGKQGRMAKAIRSVVKAVAVKEHKKVNVEFVD